MADRIVLVDPNTNHVQHLDSVSFADLKVKERQNLENWVLQNPEVLGQRLLVITSEFGRFNKSKRRLDILALDANGSLDRSAPPPSPHRHPPTPYPALAPAPGWASPPGTAANSEERSSAS